MPDDPEGPENLTLRMMRRMDEKLDRVLYEVASLKPRLTSLERQLAELRLDMVGISGRLDRMDTRLDNIE
jgi:phage shock protein A